MFSELMLYFWRGLPALLMLVSGVVSVADAASEKACPDMQIGRASVDSVRVVGVACEDVWNWVIASGQNDGNQAQRINESSYRLIKGPFKGMVVNQDLVHVEGGGPKDTRLLLTMKKGTSKVIVRFSERLLNITK